MSKNNCLYSGDYNLKLYINGDLLEPSRLIRIIENDVFRIELRIEGADAVYLHTDMTSEHLEMVKMNYQHGVYNLEVNPVRCGRAMFRFAAETEQRLMWEPDEYHQILTDPSVMDSIRMYTLIPNITGNIAGWTEKLKQIYKMGFNAVHILPFTRMCSSESPYSAADLFSIDSDYAANTDEFRAFAKAAADYGIMICLDIVLNHIGFENLICREHGNWIVPDPKRPDGMKRAGCYHQDSWISWEDLVLVNYEHPDLSIRYEIYDYMLEYVNFWIDAAGAENIMIRLDNLHSSNEHFIRWLIPQIRKVHPGIIILSEFFGDEYQIDNAVINYGLNLITANSWEFPFAPNLQRYISSLHSRRGVVKYFLSPVSHDTESAAVLFGTPDSSIPRYAVCALMGTGVTGIVQGYENGVEKKINFIGRKVDKNAVGAKDYSNFIAEVNSLLAAELCLSVKGNIDFYDTANDSLIVCKRRDEDGGILIAVNLDIYNSHSLDYPLIGKAETLISERSELAYNKNDDRIHINLNSCGVCVVRTGK
ncbi:MAG: alpha-amylase family glycosyl hydrolase [Spirochaetales bacterium]|uniref:Alpha-amylase family glycosyl hydrolase n=1 Tax=Candidatus Thalassospirochaeta sargassi TaxID=3119039 RepID=A0AAJ1MN02_9SPIO|nr:alpha-amylase family glycosyl hydrolase [Spirochaetales bacterium]